MTKTNLIPSSSVNTPLSTTDKALKLVGDKKIAIPVSIPVPSPFALPASLALETKVMNVDDDFVTKSAIRQAVSKELMRDPGNQNLFWHEAKGLLEIGPSVTAKLPIGGLPSGFGVSLNAGFSANALLSYRSVKPHGSSIPKTATKDKVIFPRKLDEVLKMKAGHEVEIRGRGTLALSFGAGASVSTNTYGVASVGVGASVDKKKSIAEEFGLTVVALDGKGLVRVAIARVDDKMDEVSEKLRAGCLSVLPFMPSFGDGALANMAHGAVFSTVSNIMKEYTSATASMSKTKSQQENSVACYDLDLSKPCAQEAFYRLLKLSPVVVDKLMAVADSGISKVSSRESENKIDHTKNFRALNRCIYGKSKSDAYHDGSVTKENGSRILYTDKVHVDKSEKVFKGMQEIRWEGITVKDVDGALETYFRFFLNKHSKLPNQNEVDRYFELARKLNVDSMVTEKSELVPMHRVDKLFSSKDDIDARMDFYFTEEGVLNIQNSAREEGFLAFAKANFDPALLKKWYDVSDALEYYCTLGDRFRANFYTDSAMKVVEENYAERFGSDVKTDAKIFRQARRFGDFIGNYNAVDNTRSTREFFAALGNANFDYPEIIAALANLAGRENLKVHELSLAGGDVRIESKDEGEIVHPRDQAKRLFSRNVA